LFAAGRVERMVDAGEVTVAVQAQKIIMHSRLRRKVLGQRAPLAAGRQEIQDRIQKFAAAVHATSWWRWHFRLNQRPLLVSQVRWIS